MIAEAIYATVMLVVAFTSKRIRNATYTKLYIVKDNNPIKQKRKNVDPINADGKFI